MWNFSRKINIFPLFTLYVGDFLSYYKKMLYYRNRGRFYEKIIVNFEPESIFYTLDNITVTQLG